jgi:hypothetical protein
MEKAEHHQNEADILTVTDGGEGARVMTLFHRAEVARMWCASHDRHVHDA